MHKQAITVENLSKRYVIGQQKTKGDGLRHAVEKVLRSPISWLKNQRRAQLTQKEEFWALRDVFFEVPQGQVVGLIGRNGAGKSTLLKILSRITEPTSGRIAIDGRVASLLEVGTGFHPELTGRENMYLNGTILGMTKREVARKFDAIVDFSGVEKFIDTPVKHYSSGMQVRLAFAVAAHLEPEIMIIDEVLAVGDVAFQKKCMGRMHDVAAEGRTVLFVSHNMVAVQSLCQRGIVLKNGSIVFDGTAETAVAHYLSETRPEGGPQMWPNPAKAPGNEALRFKRVEIFNDTAGPGEIISMQDCIRIETDYWILEPGKLLHITYHLLNHQGVTVLTTGMRASVNPIGVYRAVFRLPGRLLNSGEYFLKVLIVENENRVTYQNDEIARFAVEDTTERQQAYMGREPGVIQPTIAWQSEKLPDL